MINNNMGYDGDLELALIPESFRVDALNETLDDNKVLVKAKTGNTTTAQVYADWYKAVYMPSMSDKELG